MSDKNDFESILDLSHKNREINQVEITEKPKTKKADLAQVLLEKVKKEKKSIQDKREAKLKAKEFVNRVFAALNCVATRRIVNPRTKKVIGRKFKYLNDKYGNSIYDYLVYNKDEFQKNIIERCWKIRYDENDNKDCSWIDKRVQITWINTKFC